MVREKSGNFILGQKSGKSRNFVYFRPKVRVFFPEWLNAAISINYHKYRESISHVYLIHETRTTWTSMVTLNQYYVTFRELNISWYEYFMVWMWNYDKYIILVVADCRARTSTDLWNRLIVSVKPVHNRLTFYLYVVGRRCPIQLKEGLISLIRMFAAICRRVLLQISHSMRFHARFALLQWRLPCGG